MRNLFVSIHALLAERDGRAKQTQPPEPTVSIHALLAERDKAQSLRGLTKRVSIHALLAERDDRAFTAASCTREVSIHALLAERDGTRTISRGGCCGFQFTRSSRSATTGCGGEAGKRMVSIHALLAERDF